MLGIILLYFIGRHFYELAFEYEKHQWTYAILSIVIYYSGTILGAIPMVFFFEDPTNLDSSSEMLLNLLSIPFGLLACYLFHNYLFKKWNREEAFAELDDDILDRDFIDTEEENF